MNDPAAQLKRRIDDKRIPDALQQELHDAHERFHKARVEYETSMGNTEYRHQERVNEKEVAFRKAEKEVEAITAKMHEILERPL